MSIKYYLKTNWWHWLISLPMGDRLYLTVKRLLGQFPKKANSSDFRFREAEEFRDVYQEYGDKPVDEATCFEFGAGYELFITMCLGSFGFKRIYSVDRVKWIMPVALDFAAESLWKRVGFPNPKVPAPRFTQDNYRQVLSEQYRIEYVAPADARDTSLPDESIDYIFSNAVLEHIPKEVIESILLECHRLLTIGGVVAFRIDYRDHCRDNNSISPYHFLRFTEEQWRRMYPPDGHNRLRHVDFRNMFEQAGFDVVFEKSASPFDPSSHDSTLWRTWTPEKLSAALRKIPLAPEFQRYTEEELAILYGFWILKKRNMREKDTNPSKVLFEKQSFTL